MQFGFPVAAQPFAQLSFWSNVCAAAQFHNSLSLTEASGNDNIRYLSVLNIFPMKSALNAVLIEYD